MSQMEIDKLINRLMIDCINHLIDKLYKSHSHVEMSLASTVTPYVEAAEEILSDIIEVT